VEAHVNSLVLERNGGVATITINRPARLNALDAVTKRELRRVMESLDRDDTIRTVVITGAGERAFVAGTDIEELTGLNRDSGRQFSADGQAVMDLIEQCRVPVIAAVNGYALGGGCELVMACHLRLASERAKFGMPEINLGIIPGYGGTQRLVRLVGREKALELMLTGAHIGAEDALRIGLIHKVVPAAALMQAAADLAAQLAAKAPRAVEALMRAVRAAPGVATTEGMQREAEEFGKCCATADFQEGVRAFLDKRPPAFRGA
jgi:enoyl-CoA hydratase